MPIVEINENECVYMRDGVVCRGNIDSHVAAGHWISANPVRALPLVTLTVEVSNMQAPRRTTELEYQRQRVEEVQRLVASGLVSADALAANRNGDIFAPSVRTAAQSTTALPAGWGISNTPRQQANSFEDAWAVASRDGSNASIEADRPEPAEVSLQPGQNVSAAVNEMLAEANEDALAALQDSLSQPEANNAATVGLGPADFRVGALGRAWLVSHFVSAAVRLSTVTTPLNVLNMCNDNVRQALEASANLVPQMSERWLRVAGYRSRADFPPAETAAATNDTIYFARDTRTLYWFGPADGFWRGLPIYVPFQLRVYERPTTRAFRIQHIPARDDSPATAQLNDRVDRAMSRVDFLALRRPPADLQGVVTFASRAVFTPYAELNNDARDRWLLFARDTGALYRPCRVTGTYEQIASAGIEAARELDAFTLPAGMTIPTRAVQGDPVSVLLPRIPRGRTWQINHVGDFDNTGGMAELAFNRQVDAVMAPVTEAELPENFRGVVTYAHRDDFPVRETLADADTRLFYFSRSEGDLYRVTPFRSGFQYTRIASSVAPPTAASVTSSGGLQMVSSWGHVPGSWADSRPILANTWPGGRAPSPPPPQPVHTPVPISDDRPRRLMLND